MVEKPSGETAAVFMELAACVVREVAKLEAQPRATVRCSVNCRSYNIVYECFNMP